MNKFKLMLSLLGLFLMTSTLTAADRVEDKVLKTRTGTVYAAGPAKETVASSYDKITVTVAKTGGKAQTIANIYVNNVRKGYIEFTNGKYSKTKSKTITGCAGKSVRVEIVNQSVGNTFKYKLTIKGIGNPVSICKKFTKNRTGTVYAAGPAKETVSSEADKVTVTVAKTGGKAQTIANIYVNGVRKGYIEFTNGKYTKTKSKTITGTKGKTVKVEIVNQSVGNKFKYKLTMKGACN